jgi:hypothetical protein
MPDPTEMFYNQILYERTKFCDKGITLPQAFDSPDSSTLDFSKFIVLHRIELENIPELEQCTQLMENEPNISKHIGKLVGVRGRLSSANSWDYLKRILLRPMGAYHKKKKFDERLFQKSTLTWKRCFMKNYSHCHTHSIAKLPK